MIWPGDEIVLGGDGMAYAHAASTDPVSEIASLCRDDVADVKTIIVKGARRDTDLPAWLVSMIHDCEFDNVALHGMEALHAPVDLTRLIRGDVYVEQGSHGLDDTALSLRPGHKIRVIVVDPSHTSDVIAASGRLMGLGVKVGVDVAVNTDTHLHLREMVDAMSQHISDGMGIRVCTRMGANTPACWSPCWESVSDLPCEIDDTTRLCESMRVESRCRDYRSHMPTVSSGPGWNFHTPCHDADHIMRIGGIGDVLFCMPTVRAIPDVCFHTSSEMTPLIRAAFPDVDVDVFDRRLSMWTYWHTNTEFAKMHGDAGTFPLSGFFEYTERVRGLRIPRHRQISDRAGSLPSLHGPGRWRTAGWTPGTVAICPGASSPKRTITLEQTRDISRGCADAGLASTVFLMRGFWPSAERLLDTEVRRIDDLVDVMDHLASHERCVGADSGLLHMFAWFTGRRAVGVFSSNDPACATPGMLSNIIAVRCPCPSTVDVDPHLGSTRGLDIGRVVSQVL